MTIKNQGQNVSAEIDVTTLFDIEITPVDAIETGAEITSVKLTRKDFHDNVTGAGRYANDPHPGYVDLMDIFYTQQEVNDKIKIHLVLYDSFEDLPEDEHNRSDGQANYIYLVPYEDPEGLKEGIYKEYVWVEIKNSDKYRSTESNHNDMVVEEERNGETVEVHYNYETIGSTEIDLNPIRNRLTALETLTTTHTNQITNLTNNKADKEQANANAFVITNGSKMITTETKAGNIDIDGKLYNGSALDKSKILFSDASTGAIKGVNTLESSLITNPNALTNISASLLANSTQAAINSAIDDKFNTLYVTTLPQYLLINDIKSQIWGTDGFVTAQAAESDNVLKNLKLGDYIYHYVHENFSNDGLVNEDDLEAARDSYVMYATAVDVCNHTSLRNEATEDKTFENILHRYNSIEDALLEFINEVDKDNAYIIVLDDVGIFSYTPDRNSQEQISGTVHIMQPDLTTAIPVSVSDLTNDAGFLTVVDMADYLKDIDIVDNLSSTLADKPLSANQGRVLSASIATLTSQLNTSDFITASQVANNYVPKTDIKNNLTDGGTDKVLSAEQGKWLKNNKVETAGTGLTKANDGITLNHTDSITASGVNYEFKKIKYNSTGHITSVANVTADDLLDPNGGNYTHIGSAANESQQTINSRINAALGGHQHDTDEIFDSNAYSNIGSSMSDSQATINSKINFELGNKSDAGHEHDTDEITSDTAYANIGSSANDSQKDINGKINTALGNKSNTGHGHDTGDITDDTAYNYIGSSANDTQATINSKINTAIGTHNHDSVYVKQSTGPAAVTRRTLGNTPDNTNDVNGEVCFIKLNKQVICDFFFYYTVPAHDNGTARAAFIINVPNEYLPSDIYRNENYYSYPITTQISDSAVSSLRTAELRVQYVVENNEPWWKIYSISKHEREMIHARGQLTWFTD